MSTTIPQRQAATLLRLIRSRRVAATCLLSLAFFFASSSALSGEKPADASAGVTFGVLGYVDYSNGQMPLPNGEQIDYNRFKLTRGYFTAKKKMLLWLGMRLTIDITQDETGDYKVRQKYFYAELRPDDLGWLTDMKAEIGLGHMPWLDFEEHIDPYRCQGTMAIERAHVFNSADLGISLRGDFGGPLQDAQQKTGNHHYPGRYGSWHLGIYNGGGYHAREDNKNKVAEGRITLRPLPDVIAGLQFSYLGIFGKGNSFSGLLNDYPCYAVNLGLLSFEHPVLILTAQYYQTEGNAQGTWVDNTGTALSTRGFSLFGNVKIPFANHRLSVFCRLDHFDIDRHDVLAKKTAYTMIFGGLAYELHQGNTILLAYELTQFEKDAAGKGKVPIAQNNLADEKKIQAVYQIKF